MCVSCGSAKPMTFEAGFTVFLMVLSCGITEPDKDASCEDAFNRPRGQTILLQTPPRETSLLSLFNTLMFKDQQKEAVI